MKSRCGGGHVGPLVWVLDNPQWGGHEIQGSPSHLSLTYGGGREGHQVGSGGGGG